MGHATKQQTIGEAAFERNAKAVSDAFTKLVDLVRSSAPGLLPEVASGSHAVDLADFRSDRTRRRLHEHGSSAAKKISRKQALRDIETLLGLPSGSVGTRGDRSRWGLDEDALGRALEERLKSIEVGGARCKTLVESMIKNARSFFDSVHLLEEASRSHAQSKPTDLLPSPRESETNDSGEVRCARLLRSAHQARRDASPTGLNTALAKLHYAISVLSDRKSEPCGHRQTDLSRLSGEISATLAQYPGSSSTPIRAALTVLATIETALLLRYECRFQADLELISGAGPIALSLVGGEYVEWVTARWMEVAAASCLYACKPGLVPTLLGDPIWETNVEARLVTIARKSRLEKLSQVKYRSSVLAIVNDLAMGESGEAQKKIRSCCGIVVVERQLAQLDLFRIIPLSGPDRKAIKPFMPDYRRHLPSFFGRIAQVLDENPHISGWAPLMAALAK